MIGASSGSFSKPADAQGGFICVAGVTYPAQWWLDEGGALRDIRYIRTDGVAADPRVDFVTWAWGACSVVQDVIELSQALVAGSNVITHNLNSTVVDIEIWNSATGARVTFTVGARTANTITVTVGVAVAAVRIVIDA